MFGAGWAAEPRGDGVCRRRSPFRRIHSADAYCSIEPSGRPKQRPEGYGRFVDGFLVGRVSWRDIGGLPPVTRDRIAYPASAAGGVRLGEPWDRWRQRHHLTTTALRRR
jgi:hypothetical protein